MNFENEHVMAYVDGELDAPARAAFEQALAGDARLQAAVQRERALRAALSAAYDPVLDEPVPAALRQALRPPATVVGLDEARAAKQAARAANAPQPGAVRRWQGSGWGAMAACVLLGVALGASVDWRGGRGGAAGGLVARGSAGVLVARGPLEQVLTHGLAAEPAGAEGLAPGLSFVTRDGRYCRSFAIQAAPAAAGLACRTGADWQVQALMPVEPPGASTPYRQAATALPPALLQQVDALRAGDVLDAAAERAARDRGWQR